MLWTEADRRGTLPIGRTTLAKVLFLPTNIGKSYLHFELWYC